MEKITKLEVEPVAADSSTEFDATSPDRLLPVFERRLLQSSSSRLCEYITGLPVEEIDAFIRAVIDHRIVRGKYGLPQDGVAHDDPAWYEEYLRGIARREGVEITDKNNCGAFFVQNSNAAAAYFNEDKRAGVTLDRSGLDEYARSLMYLEHEIIHALQFENTPSMPIEIMEYEAYIAGSDFTDLDSTFDRMLGSVTHWYKELSDKAGREIVPHWDSAEYFMQQVDGVIVDELPLIMKLTYEAMKQEVERQKLYSEATEEGAELDLTVIDSITDTQDLIEVRDLTERSAL